MMADQTTLFDKGEWWEDEWQDMPEFVHEDLQPFKTLIVHFESREQMKAFEQLVGQRITLETRSIWYPEAEIGRYADKRYVTDDTTSLAVDNLREVETVLDSGESVNGSPVDDGALF